MTPRRLVSLVPSLTETVAALGLADRLVGVTTFCAAGAPAGAERVGGTKNPDVDRIVALRPEVVLANTEENRRGDLERLRQAGVEVVETFPRRAGDVPGLLRDLGGRLGASAAAATLASGVERAIDAAAAARPPTPVAALTLVWRKPWMGAGPDTYIDDLLGRCGFANVLSGWQERYPRLDPALQLGPEVVLLPSEPYRFTEADLPAVRGLVGPDPVLRLVDGRLLTWHGPRTAEALRTFAELARGLAATLATGARRGGAQ